MYLDAHPWEKEEALNSLRKVRQIVTFIRDCRVKDVIIPFSELIELPTDKVRVRRGRPKLMGIIKSLELLNQLERVIMEVKGVKYVVAD